MTPARSLRVVTPEPKPTAFGAFAEVSPEARALVVEIRAEVARLGALTTTPTHATVARAKATIPALKALLGKLESAL